MAGPATVRQGFADQYDVSADLPCADAALLVPLKRSRAYGAIRKRVADLRPVDSWQEDEFHFFVFALRPGYSPPATFEAPLAVFAMHAESTEPLSAVVVTPSPDGVQAEVRNLREPDTVYTMPLPPPDEPVSTGHRVPHPTAVGSWFAMRPQSLRSGPIALTPPAPCRPHAGRRRRRGRP